MHAIAREVKDIHHAGAINIRQADALVVELVGVVEPRRFVHGDLGAKAGIAQIGPVKHFAIADAHEVGEAVARHIGQVD